MTAGHDGRNDEPDVTAEGKASVDRVGGRKRRSTLRRRTLLGTVAASTATLAGCMADTEYTVVDASSDPVDDAPISFDLEVVDPAIRVDSPGVIELTVENVDDGPIELVSMGIRPFGTLELRAEPEDHPGETWINLWSDEYEESPHVDVRPNGMRVDGEELVMTLFPDELISVPYEIPGEEVVRDATYELSGRLGDDHVLRYRRPDDENDNGTTEDGDPATEDEQNGGETGNGENNEDEDVGSGEDEDVGSDEDEDVGSDEDEDVGSGEDEGDESGDGASNEAEDDGSRLDGTGLTPATEIEIVAESWVPFR
ncbi:hypothetical protein [Natrarchaeobius chitinivorans]|uniref:DUF8130 domain-containing protein n=1 Tax=Natrarchaeobius chitinivorans TaxID=1679083 RepID=A0A3N6PBC0_NATCH|nr:hypothetical protein [Natrarchaeobius chitinivorans]RQG96549.1 hypothetical protein EA473_05410 [Natrarchaeobius chitinivorans]